jgi:predicted glycosyltransferase
VRAVIFCNEMLGLGHLRRALVLASELADAHDDGTALVVTGSHALGVMRIPPRVDVLKLPTAAVTGESKWSVSGLHPPTTLSMTPRAIHELRAQVSLAAVREFRPDVVLVDYAPLGREGDLRQALQWLRAESRATVTLGLWEVADGPDQQRWTRQLIADVKALYDLVMIYGEPTVDDVRVERLRAAGVPVRMTGMIGPAPAPSPPSDLEPGYLLITAGGGVDGYALLDTAIEAVRLRPLPMPAVLVTGPMMDPAQVVALKDAAIGLDAQVHRLRTDMDAVLSGARATVSMAGYATVAEVVASGKPALLVPRAFPRDEQLRRARRLATAGLVELLEPDALDPAILRNAFDRLLERPARAPQRPIGAATAVSLLLELSRRRVATTAS